MYSCLESLTGVQVAGFFGSSFTQGAVTGTLIVMTSGGWMTGGLLPQAASTRGVNKLTHRFAFIICKLHSGDRLGELLRPLSILRGQPHGQLGVLEPELCLLLEQGDLRVLLDQGL